MYLLLALIYTAVPALLANGALSDSWLRLRDASDLTVSTTNGRITGHLAENRSIVVEFLGIPYAQSPTGDLRFAAPKSYEGSGSYEASKWVSALLVYGSIQFSQLTIAFRDCMLLFLLHIKRIAC